MTGTSDGTRTTLAALSRREFVQGASAAGALWFAAACARDEPPATPMLQPSASDAPSPPHTLAHFSAAQAADIDAIASRIIPTDDTPGAHEAGVVYFIDRALTTTLAKDQAPMVDAGLVALTQTVRKQHGASATFAGLSPAQQDDMLRGIEKTEFFGTMRFATIAGFLSLPKYGGNKDFLGWAFIGQEHALEQHPPFGWYDRPDNQQALLGRVL